MRGTSVPLSISVLVLCAQCSMDFFIIAQMLSHLQPIAQFSALSIVARRSSHFALLQLAQMASFVSLFTMQYLIVLIVFSLSAVCEVCPLSSFLYLLYHRCCYLSRGFGKFFIVILYKLFARFFCCIVHFAQIAAAPLACGSAQHVLLGVLLGGRQSLAVFSWQDADYRLSIFPRIEIRSAWDGGCIMGKKFFYFDKSFLRGHNSPEINFRFQITGNKKNRNDFTHFDFIFSSALYSLPSHKEHQELR